MSVMPFVNDTPLGYFMVIRCFEEAMRCENNQFIIHGCVFSEQNKYTNHENHKKPFRIIPLYVGLWGNTKQDQVIYKTNV